MNSRRVDVTKVTKEVVSEKLKDPPRQTTVQSHDILYRVSQDIPYTLVRAKRAREVLTGWLGERWTYGNSGCGLWWRRSDGRRRWPSCVANSTSRVRWVTSGCGATNKVGSKASPSAAGVHSVACGGKRRRSNSR